MSIIGKILIGFVSGMFAGLFGVGGGIIIVPALMIFYSLDVKMAIGTSLAAIVPAAFVGSLTHFKEGHVELKTSLILVCGSVFGTYLGSRLVSVLPSDGLKKAYALFLFAVALKLLFEKA